MTDKTGGSAFPTARVSINGDVATDGVELYGPGMTLRDWFATHAPEPTADEVAFQSQLDANRNPHNDYHKPPRRGRLEIIADLKFAYADAMLAARSKT